jgi:light-regulated signal transduction histidine kinase (bacteriophytochrome)
MNLIMDSASRMSDLILAILDYSRIGGNKNLTRFDCNAIIENVKNDLNYMITQSGGKIIIENPLPVILGYQAEFNTLIQNIIGNALKFRKKDVAPVIIIHSHTDHTAHHFCIQDNGIGMEQKYANKIFLLFSRLHTKDVYEGTGIGLTHSKKIVELHGGKIWVESVKGQGTSFHFYISKHLKMESTENSKLLEVTN